MFDKLPFIGKTTSSFMINYHNQLELNIRK